MLVYFDTNVVRDIFENRIANADQKLQYLKSAIENKTLTVVPSFECLAEIILVLLHDKDAYRKVYGGYCKLASWECALKESSVIFRDDICSFANGSIATPFMRPDKNCLFMQAVNNERDVLSDKILKETAVETLRQNKDFVDGILSPDNIAKRVDCTQEDFRRQFEPGRIAEIMVVDFAKKLGVLEKCKRRGLINLLNIPTIRLRIGYILHCWYKQMSTDAKARNSDAYDCLHATLSGAVGNIVTGDRKLKNAICEIPGHSVNSWTLDEFIKELGM